MLWKNARNNEPSQRNNLVQSSHLIFDFDGTLVDSLELHRELFNTLARKYGRPEIQPEDFERFRQMSAREFFRALRIPLYRLPGLLDEGRRLLADRFDELKLFPGIQEVLEELARTKTLAVVSSTPEPILRSVLEREGVASLFSEIRSERNLFGKHRVIQKVLRDQKWEPTESVYLGDEVRDVEAATKAGVSFVGVGWGFTDAGRLSKGAQQVVLQPADIPLVF